MSMYYEEKLSHQFIATQLHIILHNYYRTLFEYNVEGGLSLIPEVL